MTQQPKIKIQNRLFFKISTIFSIIALLITLNFKHISSFYKSYQAKKNYIEDQNIIEKTENIEIVTNNTDEKSKELSDSLSVEIDKEKLQAMELKDMESYRLYLVHTAKLSRKFASNLDYSEDIEYLLHYDKYPEHIHNALINIQNYLNQYLPNKYEPYRKVEIEGNFIKSIMGKIITIKQENPEYNNMELDRKKLQDYIDIIEGYFYSPEFLKYYLNYD